MAGSDSFIVHVRNLPPVTEEAAAEYYNKLKKHFNIFGNIILCSVPPTEQENAISAYIQYATRNQATIAYHMFKGNILTVTAVKSNTIDYAKLKCHDIEFLPAMKKSRNALGNKSSKRKREVDTETVTVQRRKNGTDTSSRTTRKPFPNELLLLKLKYTTSRDVITTHFSKYGSVTKVILPMNRSRGTNKGFGFLAFKKEENMKAALEDDHEIDGAILVVTVNKPKEAPMEKPSKKAAVATAVESEEEEEEEEEEEDEDKENEGDDDDEEEEEM